MGFILSVDYSKKKKKDQFLSGKNITFLLSRTKLYFMPLTSNGHPKESKQT
jgi:hypothetical protein